MYKKPDGSFVAFALNTDKRLVHTYQTAPGGSWSAWTGIDGGGVMQGKPEVEAGGNGGLVVFARGTDKQLYHLYQNSPSSGWSNWQLVVGGQVE